MTVRELCELLSGYPDNMLVFVDAPDDGFNDTADAEEVSVVPTHCTDSEFFQGKGEYTMVLCDDTQSVTALRLF